MVTKPGTNEKAHLHPFISLKVLHEALGANDGIELSTMSDTFTVEPAAFIEVEYPVNDEQPTKQVVNGTKTVYEEHKEATTWSLVLYAVLMFICLILVIVFTKMLCSGDKNSDSADKILGEDREPLTGGQVNPSHGTSTRGEGDKNTY